MNRLAGSPGRLWEDDYIFNPLSLSPYLWLDASVGVETTTGVPATVGQAVANWRDQSGNGNHASQAAGGQQPVFSSDGVTFTGVQKNLVTSLDIVRPYVIFVVEKPLTVPGASTGRRTLSSGTQNRIVSATRTSGNTAYVGSTVSTYFVTDTNSHALELKVTNSGSSYFVDGVDRTTTPGSTGDWGTLVLGRTVAAEPAETNIKEVLVFGDLSDDDRTRIRQYLTTKYGL